MSELSSSHSSRAMNPLLIEKIFLHKDGDPVLFVPFPMQNSTEEKRRCYNSNETYNALLF